MSKPRPSSPFADETPPTPDNPQPLRSRIADLERQLAEAQGKLGALKEDAKKVQDAGPSKDDQWWIDRILPLSQRLDRILGGKGD